MEASASQAVERGRKGVEVRGTLRKSSGPFGWGRRLEGVSCKVVEVCRYVDTT